MRQTKTLLTPQTLFMRQTKSYITANFYNVSLKVFAIVFPMYSRNGNN